ncbi:SDR family oxidoreductase [Shimia sagamensis]|uniref:NADP-dependent 3-hydroxy acid dehydrogenase YdfG n=1 Tax=Shimia sagamensis TaxID=1566352 RepID=A0ABY1N6M1_9RHOB|nr:SDR family oxidoreductase [Shimia sagamensis]SMP01827.1 NADP-dependent 3-hydroxy acid dehydrogenase YdfG [Shimia sagamensis]
MAKQLAAITGAGSGLGQALAIELCGRGLLVAGLGRRKDALNETATLAGDSFTPVVADVSDPGQVRAAFETIRAIAPVSILINNAGVYPHRDILDETPESFMQTVAINLGGTVACTSEALKDMTVAGRGRILNVSSFADMHPLPCSAAYSVSKGAVTTFSRALVADLGDRLPKIVISTWMPGMLNTDMGLAEGLDPAVAAKWGAGLALWEDPSLNGAVFEMDREILPPRGLKGRLKDAVRLKRRKPRLITT